MRAQPKVGVSHCTAGRAALVVVLALLASTLPVAECTAQTGGPILHVTVNDQTF